MQFKAAVKKLFKFLPKQAVPELGRAIEVDDKMMAGSVAVMTEDGEVEIIETTVNKPNEGQRASAAQQAGELFQDSKK